MTRKVLGSALVNIRMAKFYLISCFQLFDLVVSWGLKQEKAAFRPAMELTSGELSAIGGKFVFMTATATSSTVRLLLNQLPEVKNWEFILNSPLRDNVTIIVPPADKIPSKFEVLLEPFIKRMVERHEVYLILVRGKQIS